MFTANSNRFATKFFSVLYLVGIQFTGFAQKTRDENEEPEAPKTRALYITAPKLMDTNKYTYQLNVLWGDSTMASATDRKTYRTITRDEEFERYELTTKSDSVVYAFLTIKERKSYNHYVTLPEEIKVTEETVEYTMRPIDEEIVKGYFKYEYVSAFNEFREDFRDEWEYIKSDWESHVLYVSYYQGRRTFGEILYGPARYTEDGSIKDMFKRHRSTSPSTVAGPAIGAEFNFKWREGDFIWGPKIGIQGSTRFVNGGIHFVYYTDFTGGGLYLKPRVGINLGCPFLNISYARAIRLGGYHFGTRVNKHQVCLNVIVPLKLEEW